jgi:predicted MFS family arabinose efflux permease
MAVYLIGLMCLLNHSGFGGSRVVISLYALELGASQFSVGLLMALYALCPMLLALYAGRLTDRLGPRIPMLIGTVGVMVALLIPPLFPGMTSLFVCAFALGSSFHFFFVAVQGTVGDLGGEANRARNFAVISVGFSAAGFVGPSLAGVAIDHLGFLPAFVMLSLFTIVPLILILFAPGFLPKAKGSGKRQSGRSVMDLWRIGSLRNALLASGILSSAWDLFQFYFPVYGHSLGLSASMIGFILGVFAIATFAIRMALPALARRYSEAEVLTIAVVVSAGAFLLFPMFSTPIPLGIAAFILGLGVGCGQPMSMSLIFSLSPAGRASESAGLRVTVNNVTHLFMPLLFGTVGTAMGYAPVFVSNSVMLLGGAWLLRRNMLSGRSPKEKAP